MNEEIKDPFEGGVEVEANWFKFKAVGDSVKGTLVAKHLQKGTAPFPDQYVYELDTKDGGVVNVGISVNKKGTVQRLNSCKLGEIIGIWFKSTTPAKTKGFADTKNLVVKSWGMDETFTFDHDDNGEEIPVSEVDMNK
jgi:hypothetical protein